MAVEPVKAFEPQVLRVGADEIQLASYSLGQAVAVKVAAYLDTAFSGKISYIGDVADAITHRISVRAEVSNGRHLLKPQMLANFDITLSRAVASVAVPFNALARDGDGSISAWVTQPVGRDPALPSRRSGNLQLDRPAQHSGLDHPTSASAGLRATSMTDGC